jgi:signal transduction histidine kinase
LIAEDSRSVVMEHFKKQIKGEIPYHHYVYCRQDKQGQHFPTENKVKLIQYNGESAVLGLCSDITERIEMEKKIRQQDRLAIIGKLTTSIAHEIRNPLSAIKVNVELLLEKLNLEGYNLRRLQIASEQLTRLESVISQMLEFAKPLKLNYSLTGLHEIIDDSIKLLEQRIKENNVSLVKRLDPALPVIMVDKERMLQAVDNVLRNALEALDNDTKHKRIELESKQEIYHSKEYVKLSIADNGVGISPEEKRNIFEPFFTNGKKDGVGLGLPIVKKIVDTHHGHIQVESERGEGTSFNLFIPIDIYS